MSPALGEEIALGWEPPMNTQFSVFLDNRVGKLMELVEVFEGHALDLAALSVVDSTGHAVVRVLTSRAVLARRLLQRQDFSFSEADVLVVELMPDQHLSEVCRAMLSAELSIHYAYPLLSKKRGRSAIVIHTDDMFLASQILRRKMFTLLGENDLGEGGTPGQLDDSGYPI